MNPDREEPSTVPDPPMDAGRRTVDKHSLEAQFSGYKVVDHAQVTLTPVVLRDPPSPRAQSLLARHHARAASRSYGRRS